MSVEMSCARATTQRDGTDEQRKLDCTWQQQSGDLSLADRRYDRVLYSVGTDTVCDGSMTVRIHGKVPADVEFPGFAHPAESLFCSRTGKQLIVSGDDRGPYRVSSVVDHQRHIVRAHLPPSWNQVLTGGFRVHSNDGRHQQHAAPTTFTQTNLIPMASCRVEDEAT